MVLVAEQAEGRDYFRSVAQNELNSSNGDEAIVSGGLPDCPVYLSAQIREIRTQKGLRQRRISESMGLHNSIPSLWEQGKRPVPPHRIQGLALALGVSTDELLSGVVSGLINGEDKNGRAENFDGSNTDEEFVRYPARGRRIAHQAEMAVGNQTMPGYNQPARETMPAPAPTIWEDDYLDLGPKKIVFLPRIRQRLVGPPAVTPTPEGPPLPAWTPEQRPVLVGQIPVGWELNGRVNGIRPDLPEGYWLDPIKLEKQPARALLRSRLCQADQTAERLTEVPGVVLVERIHGHCGRIENFWPANGRVSVLEAIFREVVMADNGGLTDEAIVTLLKNRPVAPVDKTLLRRLRDTTGFYPMTRVDAELLSRRPYFTF